MPRKQTTLITRLCIIKLRLQKDFYTETHKGVKRPPNGRFSSSVRDYQRKNSQHRYLWHVPTHWTASNRRWVVSTRSPSRSPDSNSIKAPFICRGGPSNRLGRAREAQKASRFAQQLRGPTFAGSCMDLPSVPTPPLPPPPPPPVHTCSCLQQMFEEVNLPSFPPPPASSSSHKPKKKNKKDTQKLPLAALRTPRPGEWEGGFREEEQRRERLGGKGEG